MFCRPWFMNYSAHVISAEEKARLDEVTNLPSMYNGQLMRVPHRTVISCLPFICSGEFHRAERMFNILGERASTSTLPSRFESNFEILACHFFFRWRDDARE